MKRPKGSHTEARLVQRSMYEATGYHGFLRLLRPKATLALAQGPRMSTFQRALEAPMRPTHEGASIFIAEDDPDYRPAIEETLAEAGFRPVAFPTARMLLKALVGAQELPDLIVTDIEMPGLSGVELLAILRQSERWQRIPVLVITGRNDLTLPVRLDAPVVYKPDVDGLQLAITALLRRRIEDGNEPERSPRRSLAIVVDVGGADRRADAPDGAIPPS